MKKSHKTLLACLFVFASSIHVLFGSTWTDPDTGITWVYSVRDGKASVGVGPLDTAVPKTTTGAITIPSSLGGYPVTSVGSFAFYGCNELSSVTIPDNVTSIDSRAF